MQILGSTLDLEEEIAVATEAVRQARLLGPEPVTVRDAAIIDSREEILLLA